REDQRPVGAAVTDDLRASLPRTGSGVSALAVVMVLFLLLPLLVILPMAASSGVFLKFPPSSLSTRWFGQVFTDPEWRAAFWQSVKVAGVATVMAVVAGTSAALALRRVTYGTRLLRTLMIAPMVIPVLVLPLGLYLGVQD